MILLVAISSLPLAAGPAPKLDDWVQVVIFTVVILGSVISGLVNAARKKMAQGSGRREILRRHVEVSNRQADGEETAFPQTDYQRPVARPMPPSAPPVVSPMRPAAQSAADLVKMLRERIEAQARQQAENRKAKTITIELRRESVREIRQPAPLKQRPTAIPTRTSVAPQSRQAQVVSRPSSAPAQSHRLGEIRTIERGDEIDDRERTREEGMERRLGSVHTHMAGPSPSPRAGAPGHSGNVFAISSSSDLRLDRGSLRRAILLNEILGPPVALRDPLAQDDKWDVV